MDIRVQHARHEDRFGLLVAAYLDELEDWVWMWRIADMSTQPGKANPTQIIDPGNWKYGLGVGEPPNVDGLTRGDDPDPPTDPQDMPESASVPPPGGQTTFSEAASQVSIEIVAAPTQVDGYYIFGEGAFGTHHQAVGSNDLSVVLRADNGTGAAYPPASIDGQWFCVKSIRNAEVSLEQECNVFNATDPTGPPPDPINFEFTGPSFDRFRYDADIQSADGAELELADDVSGSPGPFDIVAGGPGDSQITQGQLPLILPEQPANTTKHGRIRSYNLVDLAREYSGYAGPLSATTPEMPSPGARPNDPGYPTTFCIHDFSTMPPDPSTQIPGTGGGFVNPWHRSGNGFENMNDNYLGGVSGTGSVSASTALVTSGNPQNPHGMPNIWRIRWPVNMGNSEGKATGNGGGVNFNPEEEVPQGGRQQFRRIYQHYWILMEGFPYAGVRALQRAAYRITQEIGAGRRENNYWFCQAHENMPARDVDTGQCGNASGIPTGSPMDRCSPKIVSLPGPLGESSSRPNGAPRGYPDGYGNNFFGSGAIIWTLGRTPNWTDSRGPDAQSSPCTWHVGRWHRIETDLDLGTPDNPNGSFRFWFDGVLAAEVVGVRMLSSQFVGEDDKLPNQGYERKTIFCMYHPNGTEADPNRKANVDYTCYADFYMTGVEM